MSEWSQGFTVTHTKRELRFPPQYHHLNSQHPQGSKKKKPLHVPRNRVSMERDAPSPEPLVYPFIYVCRSPQKEAFPRNAGKIYGRRPRSPTRMEGLHRRGCGPVPQGDRWRHWYHYLSAMQPSAQYLPPWLGWTRAPLASVWHSNPQQVTPSTPVTASNVTQGRVEYEST